MSKLNKKNRLESQQRDEEKYYKFMPYKVINIEYCINNNNVAKYPTPRSGHRSICTDGSLYCLGGFNPEYSLISSRRSSTRLFQELWKFNIAKREWKLCLNHQAANMPTELASNAVTLSNGKLYAFGGTSYPFGETCSNECYIFQLDKMSVTKLTVKGELPIPQYGPAIVIHNNYLYTIGGTTGFEYNCDVHRLNLLTKVWERMYKSNKDDNNDPKSRYRHEIVYTGEFIYVLGGGTSSTAFQLDVLPAFDLKRNCWQYITTKPDLNSIKANNNGYPGPRKCYSCIQQINEDNSIEAVIAGGYADDYIYYSDIWKLNFNTMEWKKFKNINLPNPLYFHSAATPGNGCMYIFGGIEIRNSLTRTNNLYKVWTRIPTLEEMCWEAMCHYNPNLSKHTKNYLMSYGIPRKFINRLFD